MSQSNNASLEVNYETDSNSSSLTSPPSGSRTVVKYEKSSCLFCNDWFDSQTFTEHLIHCGQVLEQCPNTCSVFVPRIRMRAHMKECPRNKQQALTKQKRSSSMEHLDALLEHRVQIMEHDLNTVRSVLNEEIRQRLHLITDVGNLRKQNQVAEEWTHKTEEAINTLKRRVDEEYAQRVFEVEQCQNDYRYCYDQTQAMKTEYKTELDELQDHINRVSISVTEHQNHLNDNILKLEESVLENERLNRDKFLEVEEFLEQVNQDLKLRSSNDLSAKIMNLDVEVKSMKNIVCETEERCDKLEAIIGDMDKRLAYTMQAVADLENHVSTQQRLTSIINTRGHLVWRIKDYSKKMEEARQYDSILHSAMFSNRQYGYALRLDIQLNGRGAWKGRNMIACLNVIAGEYDPLLAWPCRLKGDVIIRDQNAAPSEAQDYIKTISVRKKNDELLSTNQFFFIPHKEIVNYVRNDCLFVEVRVK